MKKDNENSKRENFFNLSRAEVEDYFKSPEFKNDQRRECDDKNSKSRETRNTEDSRTL